MALLFKNIHHSIQIPQNKKMNTTVTTFLACTLLGLSLSALVDRAPAPTTSDDCACQCDGTTYLDQDDNIQVIMRNL